ncbi:DNA-directed RNA polymerase subunit alpha [Spiroplasma eriocheiris]|uniref:DNA-directed RNA polymerase subunit alpha n=1 Tax=Spiroplasma eriocheiris TaxID=315358 RepID=A0A0H3XKG2_9MOLU|nr:DNA-directed RNA polymerase subunit alpha [Spiroplasma eriocheiris]AHF57438.1 DNA-directed RNA polymerase subunit alpha [Spiroplasma eriocheiris CCTCC M 207170]AKM53894.1 DNA-directed RNA polymerase subunit alpha [Spiroplasma eriocheiris]
MKQFIRPEFKLEAEDKSNNYGKFLVEPLERGFGITLGNALRRTLLSSTPGAAVFAIRIKGASHEFTAIPGVVEHVTKIILNIKNLVLKIDQNIIPDGESVILKINSNKEGDVLAKDIELPAGVEVINKDLHIATIAKGGELNLELHARNSRGYKSFNDNKKEKKYADLIVIDSNYSPVQKVSYTVEPTKVGKNADLEKLEIEVQTDSSITPVNAIAMAGKILSEHLEFFINLNEAIKATQVISSETEKEEDELDRSIDELEFTPRSQNCLKRAKIETLRDLISKTEEEIQEIRNLGKKSLTGIKEKVAALGLHFRRD